MSKHESKKTHAEETKKEVESKNEIKTEIEKSKPIDETETLVKQIEELKAEIVVKNERILQLEQEVKAINLDYVTKITEKANEANLQLKTKLEELTSKMQQELTIHKKYAIEKSASSLIDIVNQFAMALSYKPTDPNIAKYQSGFQMFLTMFTNLLTELGINEIDVKIGDEFNPEFMECIEFLHSNEMEDNKVIKIITKGYRLHDRLIKPTVVNVVRKKN